MGGMRLEQDHYAVLGVRRGATEDEIKKAFRGLARSLHPDVSDHAPDGRFHDVLAAYHVLSHPKRRRLYDLLRPGSRRRSNPTPAVPPVELTLEWWEAERGVSKPVELDETTDCAACGGSGVPTGLTPAVCIACHGSGRIHRVRETDELRLLDVYRCEVCVGRGHEPAPLCDACDGSGRKTASAAARIRIPPGVQDGDLLQVDGVVQRFRLNVGPRPRDSRLVLLASALALAAAVALFLYLLFR
jgi:molecular chaperone DnaJ